MSPIEIITITITPEELKSTIAAAVRSELIELEGRSKNQEPVNEKYLTRKDVARILQIDLSTVNNWKKSGKLKAYQIGSGIRFLQSELPQSLKAIKPLKPQVCQ